MKLKTRVGGALTRALQFCKGKHKGKALKACEYGAIMAANFRGNVHSASSHKGLAILCRSKSVTKAAQLPCLDGAEAFQIESEIGIDRMDGRKKSKGRMSGRARGRKK